MIAKYHPSSPERIYQFFLRYPLTAPVHCHLQGGKPFLLRLKHRHFFLTSTPISIKIETGCKYSPFVNHLMLKIVCQSNERVLLKAGPPPTARDGLAARRPAACNGPAARRPGGPVLIFHGFFVQRLIKVKIILQAIGTVLLKFQIYTKKACKRQSTALQNLSKLLPCHCTELP